MFEAIDTGILTSVLRAKGFMWVATRPELCGSWSQAGSSLTFGPAGLWYAELPRDEWPDDQESLDWIEEISDPEVGDRRQEIVFIGVELPTAEMERALGAALLTDAEMAAGREAGLQFEDPLPTWELEPDEV